jgi:hypothetical protein
MRSTALAVAWELKQRHRWGLVAVGLYLTGMAVIRLTALRGAVGYESTEAFAFSVLVPMTSISLYLLAVFTYGLSGDIASRQSMYPARAFTLPVTSSAMAGWPMLYGTASMVVLWFAFRFLALWPPGVTVPVFWPALLAADLLAWTQALVWMPYALPGLRVFVTIFWLITIDAIVLIALEFRASEGVMLALLAPHVPVAFLVARAAIARARRGDVPDWRGHFARAGRMAGVISRRTRPFASAARAQFWFEWRQHGRLLPVLVAILLPFELSMLFVFPETPMIIFETLGLVLVTPPFMAAFVAATIGKDHTTTSDGYGLPPFLATKPMSNASIIAAKLNVTVLSTLISWALVIAAIPVAVKSSRTSPVVLDFVNEVAGAVGKPRAIALGIVALLFLLGSTWKQLVQSLYIRMSGREWLIKTSVFATLAVVTVFFFVLQWVIRDRGAVALLWELATWILAVLVLLKVAAAAWVFLRLCDERLVSDGTLVSGAALWSAAVFVVYGAIVWIVPDILERPPLFMLLAILGVPLARLSGAPLALAKNRHR